MSRESPSVGMAEAPVVFPKRRDTALKRRSVIVMILLTVFTLGLYYPVWFVRRRAALNQLDSPRKLQAWPFVVFLAYVTIRLVVSLVFGPHARADAPVDTLIYIGQIAIGILIVVQCFYIKDILEDHLAPASDAVLGKLLDDSAKLSALMTFFFSIYYLQHVINTRVAARP